MVFISAMKCNANANANFVDIAKKEEEKRYNLLTYNLPYTDEKIHKAFDEYLERKYNEKMYGHPFIEKEVLEGRNGEYLFYDLEEERFVEDNIACIPDLDDGPYFFVMDWVKKIYIKRDKSNVETKLDIFLKKSLYKKVPNIKIVENLFE